MFKYSALYLVFMTKKAGNLDELLGFLKDNEDIEIDGGLVLARLPYLTPLGVDVDDARKYMVEEMRYKGELYIKKIPRGLAQGRGNYNVTSKKNDFAFNFVTEGEWSITTSENPPSNLRFAMISSQMWGRGSEIRIYVKALD